MVLVQSLAPGARAIQFAARHDSDGFLNGELERREALGYPPFRSLIRVVCSASEAEPAVSIADSVRERVCLPEATVLGPAPLFRLRGRARSQLMIKATDRGGATAAVGAAVADFAAGASRQGVSISVDVDPQ
jgi:primosomal protein N' (replication factor Y)